MNRKQLAVAWVWAFVICAMGVYPPWIQFSTRSMTTMEFPHGYSLICAKWIEPRDALVSEKLSHMSGGALGLYDVKSEEGESPLWGTGIRIDFTRLVIQWICVTSIALCLFVTFRK
jgi:hypothetical protein